MFGLAGVCGVLIRNSSGIMYNFWNRSWAKSDRGIRLGVHIARVQYNMYIPSVVNKVFSLEDQPIPIQYPGYQHHLIFTNAMVPLPRAILRQHGGLRVIH